MCWWLRDTECGPGNPRRRAGVPEKRLSLIQPSIANSTDLYTTWLRARGSLASRCVVSADPGIGRSLHRKPACATTFWCLEFADGNLGLPSRERRLAGKVISPLLEKERFFGTLHFACGLATSTRPLPPAPPENEKPAASAPRVFLEATGLAGSGTFLASPRAAAMRTYLCECSCAVAVCLCAWVLCSRAATACSLASS
jgi:hypothetical protein